MHTATTRRSRPLSLLLAALLLLNCAAATADEPVPPKPPTGVSYAGGDGSSIEKAVVILGADEMSGVDAEYKWLRDQYPGWAGTGQSLQKVNGRDYDVINFIMPDGSKHTIYFDITDFFGKM